jgi:hypothetical protein
MAKCQRGKGRIPVIVALHGWPLSNALELLSMQD